MSPRSDIEQSITLTISLSGDYSDVGKMLKFSYYNDPSILSLIPAYGSKQGGTTVVVQGANFKNLGSALKCLFGTVFVDATYINSTSIKCVAPPSDGVETPIPLHVSQNLQQSSLQFINFFYYESPALISITPAIGPTTGGTPFVVEGKGLLPFQALNISVNPTAFFRFGSFIVKANITSSTRATGITPISNYATTTAVEVTDLCLTYPLISLSLSLF
jgi:hypothetical protein